MTTTQERQEPLYEAPASVTVKFHLRGFDTMLTLRDFSGADLLPKLTSALAALESMGAQPTASGRPNRSTNGPAPDCPTHDKPMKPSKHGSGWYCPTKVADDDGTGKPVYCKQKAK